MRLRLVIPCLVVLVAALLFMLWRSDWSPLATAPSSGSDASTPQPAMSDPITTMDARFARGTRGKPAESNAPTSATTNSGTAAFTWKSSYADAPEVAQLSPSAQQAAHLVMRFATAARVPNFDPTVIAYRDTTNRTGVPNATMLSTRTHSVSVRGIVETFTSYFDSERPLDPDARNHAKERWYMATGAWNEKDAVAETIGILERLDAMPTLNAVRNGGTHSLEAPAYDVPDPSGKMVHVTPYVTVTLYDREMRAVVTAQYRIGPNGPIGLTRWHHWPGNI